MKKRKIQIAVISILVVLTFGGAFLNHKFAQVTTSKSNKTEVANKESKKVKEEKEAESKNENKEKNEQEKENASSEKKNEALKESDIEKENANTEAEKVAANSAESSNHEQGQASNPAASNEVQKNSAAEQKETPAAPENKPAPEAKKEVTLSIRGTAGSSSAYFISPQKVTIKDGQTVMDVLSDYCRSNGIQVGIRGGTYVAGINNLYEFDKGAESGWLYRVNGVFPSYGAAQYSLQPGDTIEWMYTEDMGKDVGAPQL